MKMKIRFLVSLVLWMLHYQTSRSQICQWAARAGGPESDYANCIDVDNFGNSYVAGTFHDSITFGSSTLVNLGKWSVFISKYDPGGNFLWAKIAAEDSAISVSGIVIGETGKLSIVGQYFGSAVFGTTLTTILQSNGSFDVYVAEFDSIGDLLWARSTGGSGIDFAGGVSSDKQGNVYLIGDLHLTSYPYSGSKIFLEKYDSSGTLSFQKSSLNFETGHFGNGIKTDSIGNSYITGEFFNTLVFDSTAIIDAGNIESNAFIAKFDNNGNFVWGQKAGAPTGYCGSKAIDIDNLGNCYVTGYYHGSINLGSNSITSTSGVGNEVFIAKCDLNGNFVWVNESTGTGSSRHISLDENGIIYVSGTYLNTLTFGSTSITSIGGSDIFVAAINPTGTFIWANSYGGIQADYIGGMKVRSNGIYLSGYFSDIIYFGNSISLLANSTVKYDVFVSKLSSVTGLKEENVSNIISVYPNPFSFMTTLHSGKIFNNATMEVYNSLGQKVRQINSINGQKLYFQRDNLPNGFYFVVISENNKVFRTEELILTGGEARIK
jgi:hypothetical protein